MPMAMHACKMQSLCMNNAILSTATATIAIGCAVIGGAFYAFSTFIMKALARLPAPQGIRAMQSINITVINPWFLGLFVGMALACAVLAVVSLFSWSEPAAKARIAGCILYAVGCFGFTMAFNVPRNDEMAKLDPGAAESAPAWERYVSEWTAWNTVRTVAAVAASAALIAGVTLRGKE
jgi:uncharacterized membrane protein